MYSCCINTTAISDFQSFAENSPLIMVITKVINNFGSKFEKVFVDASFISTRDTRHNIYKIK